MHSSEEISSGASGKYVILLVEPRRFCISDSEYHRYLFLYLNVHSFWCGLCLCVLDGNCVLVWQQQEQSVSWLLELLRPGSQKLMLSLWAAPGTNDNSNSLRGAQRLVDSSNTCDSHGHSHHRRAAGHRSQRCHKGCRICTQCTATDRF